MLGGPERIGIGNLGDAFAALRQRELVELKLVALRLAFPGQFPMEELCVLPIPQELTQH